MHNKRTVYKTRPALQRHFYFGAILRVRRQYLALPLFPRTAPSLDKCLARTHPQAKTNEKFCYLVPTRLATWKLRRRVFFVFFFPKTKCISTRGGTMPNRFPRKVDWLASSSPANWPDKKQRNFWNWCPDLYLDKLFLFWYVFNDNPPFYR